jgi:uncharacterized protein
MSHPNEDLVRQAFAAFARGDTAALESDFFAEDICWHFPGRSQFAGDHRGAGQVSADLLRAMAERSGGTHRVELHDVLANDDHVVALHATRAERDGKQLEINAIQVCHIRDGKIAEVWTSHSDTYALDDFWS